MATSKPYLAIVALTLNSLISICAFAQDADDEATAMAYRKKFPNDNYMALRLVEEYDFDRGKNDLKQPVVTATGNGIAEFVALKDIASFQYYEVYNHFIDLKSFKLYTKKGRGYNLAGRSGVDRALTDDNIFFDDNRVQFYNIGFNKTGQAARVESEEEYNDSKYLNRIYFHSYFPIKERVMKFVVPQWLQIDFIEMNFAGFKIQKQKEVDGNKTIYTFTMSDLEGMKSESNAIGIAYTYPHIIVQVKAFDYDGTNYTGLKETGDLYKWYSYLYSKCQNDPSALKSTVSNIIKGKNSDTAKAKALYYWVQDNIRYIAFEDGYAGFIPATAQEVLKNKYGDCKGMANLLTEMLKLAGLDAHFTWIGTKHIPYDHSLPAMCVDNHAISTLYYGGKSYFLDATEKYVPFDENAYRIQGKSALIEKGAQYEVKKVPTSGSETNRLITKASFSLVNTTMKGHVKVTMTGNERTNFHQLYFDLPSDKQKIFLQKMLEFGNDNMVVTNVTTSDLSNREIPVVIEGDVDLSNNVTVAGKETYLSIDFFRKTFSSYVPDDKRQKGYDFESIFTFEDDFELTIPPGMKFSDVPAPVQMDNPGYSFNGSYTTNGNKIELKKTFAIKSGQIPRSDFPNWTSFLKKVRDFNDNQLTITTK